MARPTARPRGELVGQRGVLGLLAPAVHHQQIAPGPERDRPRAGRHADPRHPGDQHGAVRSRAAPEPPAGPRSPARCRPAGPPRAVRGAASGAPPRRTRSRPGLALARPDLRRRRQHRIGDHQLTARVARREPAQRGGAPLQVRVGVGDGDHPCHEVFTFPSAGGHTKVTGHRLAGGARPPGTTTIRLSGAHVHQLLPMFGQTHGNRSAVTCHLKCGSACAYAAAERQHRTQLRRHREHPAQPALRADRHRRPGRGGGAADAC